MDGENGNDGGPLTGGVEGVCEMEQWGTVEGQSTGGMQVVSWFDGNGGEVDEWREYGLVEWSGWPAVTRPRGRR